MKTIQNLKDENDFLSEHLKEKERNLKSRYLLMSDSFCSSISDKEEIEDELPKVNNLESETDTFFITDLNGNIARFEQKFKDIIGTKKNLVGNDLTDFIKEDKASEIFEEIDENGIWTGVLQFKDDVYPYKIKAAANIVSEREAPGKILFLLHDVLGKSEVEYKRFKRELLEILTDSKSQISLIEELLNRIKEFTDFEAIGIRLKEGSDFPYYETKGFPKRFVELERSLCERDEDGEIIRNPEGNPVLECMCGNVIRGRTDPDLPFFTEKGSFHTESTTELLANSSEEDRQSRTRDRCNGEGYESVILVPIPYKGENIGLLQLNDSEKEKFDKELIFHLEDIAEKIGNVIGRFIKDEEIINDLSKTIGDTGEVWKGLIETVPIGVTLLDSSGNIEYVNSKAENIMSLSKDEFVHRMYDSPKWDIKDLEGNEMPEERLPFNMVKSKKKEVNDVRFSIEKPNDERIYLSFNAKPIFDSDGNIKNVIETFKDITEEVKSKRKSNIIEDVLSTVKSINRKINRTDDLGKVFDFVTNDLSVNLDYLDVSLYLRNKDNVLESITHTGKHEFKDLKIDLEDISRGPECIKQCVEEEKIVRMYENKDLCEDCDFCLYIEDHNTVLFPIKNNTIEGILDIKLTEDRFLLEEEENVLSNLANDLSYYIQKRRKNEELKSSRERYQRLFENMNSGVAIYDVIGDCEDFILRDINRAGIKIDDLENDDVIGKSVYEVFPNFDEFGLDQVLKRVYRSDESESFPVTKYKDDRIEGWRENYVFKLPTGEVAAIYDDVTERKEAKEQLKENEQRFESLFSKSPAALWEEDYSEVKRKLDELKDEGIDDLESYLDENEEFVKECMRSVKILDVNERTLELYDAGNKQEYLDNLEEVLSGQSIELFKRTLLKMDEGETYIQDEDINYTLDGEKINVLVTWRVVPGHEDDYGKVYVSNIDITDSWVAEKKYSELYNNMNEGMALHEMIYDQNGDAVDYSILDVNPKFESILDIDRDKATGSKASELYKASTPPYIEKYDKVLKTGENVAFETYYPPMDKYFNISAFKISDDKFGTIFQDITERKNILSELKNTKNKYIKIFEKFGIPSVIVDEDMHISLANEDFCDLIKESKDRLKGRDMLKYLEENEREKITRYHENRMIDQTSVPDHCTSVLLDKYKEEKEVLVSVSYLKDTKSTIVSFFDVTESENFGDLLKNYETSIKNLESDKMFEKLKDLLGDKKISEDIKSVCLEEIVLLMIANAGEISGKELMNKLEKDLSIKISSGTMYPLLHSLEDNRLVKKHEYVKSKKYKIRMDSEAIDLIKNKINNLMNILFIMKTIYDNIE